MKRSVKYLGVCVQLWFKSGFMGIQLPMPNLGQTRLPQTFCHQFHHGLSLMAETFKSWNYHNLEK